MKRPYELQVYYNETLPPEVLGKIFDQIQDGKTVLKIREVCKFWRQAIHKEYHLPKEIFSVLKHIDRGLDEISERLNKKSQELQQRIASIKVQEEENKNTDVQCIGMLLLSGTILLAPFLLRTVKYAAEHAPPACFPQGPGNYGTWGALPDGTLCRNTIFS